MFNNRVDGDNFPIARDEISPPARTDPGPAPRPDAEPKRGSVIGNDLTILGERLSIVSQDELLIDGTINGDVSGKHVTIGEKGSVAGTVSSETVDVFGHVNGAVNAECVNLHPTSVVEGEVTHSTLSIAVGASFEGNVKRAKDPKDLKPDLGTDAPLSDHTPPASSSVN